MFSKTNKTIHVLITSILIGAVMVSCSGPYDCVPEAEEDSMITWGVVTGNADSFDGYVMMADGTIYMEDWNGETPLKQTGIQLSEEDFCDFRSRLLDLYQETQATNQPADTTHYMEYMVPKRNVKLRARWNPKYDNVGNEKWKALWKELFDLMDKAKR